MALKTKSLYICNECGHESAKWYGCCPACGEWNTMEEEIRTPQQQKSSKSSGVNLTAQTVNEIDVDDEIRFKTGMAELDRVLGGGIVKRLVLQQYCRSRRQPFRAIEYRKDYRAGS